MENGVTRRGRNVVGSSRRDPRYLSGYARRGWHPSAACSRVGVPSKGDVYREAVEEHAEAFVQARLSIINDSAASAGDRLRAMDQLESRALGRPKETVEHQGEENPLRDELLQIPPEERRAWLRDLNNRSKATEHYPLLAQAMQPRMEYRAGRVTVCEHQCQ